MADEDQWCGLPVHKGAINCVHLENQLDPGVQAHSKGTSLTSRSRRGSVSTEEKEWIHEPSPKSTHDKTKSVVDLVTHVFSLSVQKSKSAVLSFLQLHLSAIIELGMERFCHVSEL